MEMAASKALGRKGMPKASPTATSRPLARQMRMRFSLMSIPTKAHPLAYPRHAAVAAPASSTRLPRGRASRKAADLGPLGERVALKWGAMAPHTACMNRLSTSGAERDGSGHLLEGPPGQLLGQLLEGSFGQLLGQLLQQFLEQLPGQFLG